jgi:hypothetical protein
VIVSPYTWGATVGCILHANAIPVFADIDPHSLNLDPAAVARRITPRTRAIVVVHLYGQPADMDPILELAQAHHLVVIEDCAQAHGATYKGRKVGSLGHIGCFSFQASKHLPTIEGGMLVTDDEEVYYRALLLAMHPQRQVVETAQSPLARYVDSLGFNYRMHPYAAALGLARHMIPVRYRAGDLHGLPREVYREAVRAEGVNLGSYVRVPIHLRPRLQERYFYGRGCPWTCRPGHPEIVYRPGDCPVAERFCAEEELTLYSTPLCDADDALIDQLAAAFAKVAADHQALLAIRPG